MTVVAVAQRSVPVYGQYVGQTEAVKTVEVRARVEGFIERQVAHMSRLVGDLTDMSRVSTGKLQLVRRRLEQQRCRLEPDLTLVVGHGRVFAVA